MESDRLANEMRRFFPGFTDSDASGEVGNVGPVSLFPALEDDDVFQSVLGLHGRSSSNFSIAEREQLLARLEKLSPEDWHRPGRHPEFANYDVNLQMDYLAHHEAHHVYQMFQRRTPLGRF